MTGWPPGLLQDDEKKLSRWFANRLDARHQLRKQMTTQPNALRLADKLDAGENFYGESSMWFDRKLSEAAGDAAAELRRLHHNNEVLMNALWKSCGDDEDTVSAMIESQGELK